MAGPEVPPGGLPGGLPFQPGWQAEISQQIADLVGPAVVAGIREALGGAGDLLSTGYEEGKEAAAGIFDGATQISAAAGDLGVAAAVLYKAPPVVAETFNEYYKMYEDIRRSYGNLPDDYAVSLNQMTGDISGATDLAIRRMLLTVESYEGVSAEAIGIFEQIPGLMDESGAKTNVLFKQFKNYKEILEATESVMGDLQFNQALYMNQIDDATYVTLPLYTKAFEMSAEDVNTILAAQIATTGKAQTTIIEEVIAYASAISDETTIPMTKINDGALEIISNVQRFGNISAEEATRISTYFAGVGMSMDSVLKVTDQFITLEGAAATASKVAQLTGDQLNIVELSILASEDIGLFYETLRSQITLTADEFENEMMKQEQQVLMAALQFDANDMRLFLRGQFDEIGKGIVEGNESIADAAAEGSDILVANLDPTSRIDEGAQMIAQANADRFSRLQTKQIHDFLISSNEAITQMATMHSDAAEKMSDEFGGVFDAMGRMTDSFNEMVKDPELMNDFNNMMLESTTIIRDTIAEIIKFDELNISFEGVADSLQELIDQRKELQEAIPVASPTGATPETSPTATTTSPEQIAQEERSISTNENLNQVITNLNQTLEYLGEVLVGTPIPITLDGERIGQVLNILQHVTDQGGGSTSP